MYVSMKSRNVKNIQKIYRTQRKHQSFGQIDNTSNVIQKFIRMFHILQNHKLDSHHIILAYTYY